ncbi:RNA ligase family protein [bacterium]|nr:RNA ligase family protein [bacterium]
MLKYPRTPHLGDSRLQPGDDPAQLDFHHLARRQLVIEEKLDGANAGISFGENGQLLLQSRGHYLSGGSRERHFALFKSWASSHQKALHQCLGLRYQLYGEWLYAKHTIFYDQLPHYFLEFDVFDKERQHFLDTPSRRLLLQGLPLVSVPVLFQGPAPPSLTSWMGPALYKGEQWWTNLARAAEQLQLDPQRIQSETDPSPLSEGLYIKVEEQGQVLSRYKYVRSSFTTSVLDSQTHWLDRPVLPNQLAAGVDIYQC